MKLKSILMITILLSTVTISTGQINKPDSTFKRYFMGSSLFMIANAFPDPADFYQLDFGYWVTTKDAIILEAITWKYNEPLGIPYGPSFESDEESYPGYVRSFGLGLDYQRMLWKGVFSTVQATSFLQNYHNEEGVKIAQGYQLFLQLRLGYHFNLLNNRMYLEPSVAFNYWPVNTNVPEGFAQIDSNWPNYFLFEPGLNFGVKF